MKGALDKAGKVVVFLARIQDQLFRFIGLQQLKWVFTISVWNLSVWGLFFEFCWATGMVTLQFLENENGHLLVPIGLSGDVGFSVIFYRFWESVSLQIDFVGICSGTKTICIRVEVVGGIFKL